MYYRWSPEANGGEEGPRDWAAVGRHICQAAALAELIRLLEEVDLASDLQEQDWADMNCLSEGTPGLRGRMQR